MTNPFKIFKIRKEEIWLAIVSAIIFSALNSLLIINHFSSFTRAGKLGAWTMFNNKLHFSGYDPYAYMMLTKFTTYYDINRHPVYTLLWYPFYLLNHWIKDTFDFNAAMFIVAFLVVVVSVYSAIFLYRVLRELLELKKSDSLWLTAMLFSFASIMTSAMSPDHFIFSMGILLMTLYVFGKCIKKGIQVKWWKAALLYFLASGVTLTNGLKILLGVLFVDGKSTFKIKNVILILILPTVLFVSIAYWQYNAYVLPRESAGRAIIAKKEAKDPKVATIDSINKIKNKAISGETISDKPFLKWIDASSPRLDGFVENFWGESIQLHKDHLLGDVYLGRPAVTRYRSFVNYVVGGIFFVFFICGLYFGRREKLLQMLLAWMSVDLLIHVVLGFGINEAYINGCHWMFIIPVALGLLLKADLLQKHSQWLSFGYRILTIYLWGYNSVLIYNYLI